MTIAPLAMLAAQPPSPTPHERSGEHLSEGASHGCTVPHPHVFFSVAPTLLHALTMLGNFPRSRVSFARTHAEACRAQRILSTSLAPSASSSAASPWRRRPTPSSASTRSRCIARSQHQPFPFPAMHPATDDGPSRGAGPQHGQEGSQEIIARANGQGLYCTRVWSVVGGLAAYDAVPTGQRRG